MTRHIERSWCESYSMRCTSSLAFWPLAGTPWKSTGLHSRKSAFSRTNLVVGGDSDTSMADSDGRHTGYGRSIGLSYKIPGVGPAGLLAPENSGPQTETFCSRSSGSISLSSHSYESQRTFLSHSGFVGPLSEHVLPVSCKRRYQNLACPALVFSQSKCEAPPCTRKISSRESGERNFFCGGATCPKDCDQRPRK
jgi:hypothetical protein